MWYTRVVKALDGPISNRLPERLEDMAGRHGKPSTGDGRKSGAKPARLNCQVQTSTGTTLWKATTALFGVGKKGKSK